MSGYGRLEQRIDMAKYIALLRAVNVGGTGKLSMTELKAMCRDAGFKKVHTYITSGNVVFECGHTAKKVKAELEVRLLAHMGAPIRVVVRTATEIAEVRKANPFPKAALNRTVAIFLDGPPPADALDRATGVKDETMRLG